MVLTLFCHGIFLPHHNLGFRMWHSQSLSNHSLLNKSAMPTQVLDRSSAKEVLRGVLHSIFFHRLFGSVKPMTVEVCEVTLPGVVDQETESLINEKVDLFLDAVHRTAAPKRGQVSWDPPYLLRLSSLKHGFTDQGDILRKETTQILVPGLYGRGRHSLGVMVWSHAAFQSPYNSIYCKDCERWSQTAAERAW